MHTTHPFDDGLQRCAANHVALSPLGFIERAARVFPERTAVVYGLRRQSWALTYERCRRLAGALVGWGIERGDTVATMLPNVPAMVEAHFGVPMAGAVLNTLNTRLDADTIAFMLRHGRARVLLTDREFSPVIEKALTLLGDDRPRVVDVDDLAVPHGRALGEIEYEAFLATADADFAWQPPADEWDAIALNYTSGTTGDPKGVVYHHRGADLNAVCNIVSWSLPAHPVYLWTLPMFHCNGWCFPWTLAAQAGTQVCLRKVEPAAAFEMIRRHRVTHLCGAPIVFALLVNAPAELRQGIQHLIEGMVAGAAPPAALIEGAERIGLNLTHVYGLTEVYGPAAVCVPQDDWLSLPLEQRAERVARQGVRYLMQEACEVLDPQTLQPVPRDGTTIGEVCFCGNQVMKGYLRNDRATREAFAGGWFHTGDLGVVQPDGYVKLKDRAKDIIISGGENISSVEVEDALARHPAVLAAAVVAMPDGHWGEVPCAFVELKAGAAAREEEIVEHCRGLLARYKVPKRVVLGTLPKTATGKIQKFVLRQQLKSASAISG